MQIYKLLILISRLQFPYRTTRKKKNFGINVTYNNVPKENVSSSKYLGKLLDQNLTSAEQIKMIETKVSRAIGVISKIKPFLPAKTLISLYYSLLHPHLLYGIVIWAFTFDSYKQRLRALQNRAIQIITNARYTDSSNPLYFKLNVLKLDDLFNYECAKLMHLSKNGRLPLHLNQQLNFKKVSTVYSHFTRQANAIHIPRTRQCTITFPLTGPNHLQNLSPKCKILNVFWT